ncbi:MAG: PKD domain-containing protein [Nanoarchaeota archaeon]|nr:PKD domain-containing protein [Nanoarchaeota archaeon]
MVDKKGLFIVFFWGIFLISLVSASFTIGRPNSSLETIYGPSDNITGWINISFSSEPLSSVFSDSRGNSANLSRVLKNNAVYPYSCSPKDCKDDYSASSGSLAKTITLNSGNSKIYGIKLTGSISGIDSFKFTLDSTAAASCANQIEIDFLDDSTLDARNKNSSDSESCSNLKNYGCFDSQQNLQLVSISTTPLCEKVTFSNSPGFLIGAWIKKISGLGKINASVYETYGGAAVATCALPDASYSGQEVSCNVNYSVLGPKEHYVCIHSNGSGEYKAAGYSPENGCGFSGTPVPSETPAAYQIFSQGKQFGPVGTLEMNKSVANGRSFAELAEDYIISKYGSLNCGSSGCVIPIKITSNSNQDVTLRNLIVRYQTGIGQLEENNFYEVQTTPAKVSSGFQKLYLDGSGFSVPSSIANYTFSLKFNSQNVLSEKMEVKDIPIIKSVTPLKTASAYPTEFTVSVASKYNLTGFSWDFGDNTSLASTLGNKTSHAYNAIGVYNLRVRVTDQRQLSATKVFMINVTSPKDLINSSLSDKERDISNLEREISFFSPFYQDAIESSLNVSYLKQRIGFLKTSYQGATSEAQYNAIVTELVGLKIPEGISKSRSAESITFFSGPDYVNIDVLREIGGGNTTGNEEGYINGVLLWQQENLDVDFDFNEFSGRYPGYIEPIARIFEIRIDEKKDISHDYYLVLPELTGFKTDAQFNRKSGYIYINLKGKNSVSFSTTENVDFTSLPAFISPAISRLTITETLPEEKKTSRWVIFSLVLFFLLVLGFLGYIIMQEWYKRRYENYLFKNRNDLYNMVNYVHNAKRKGLKNSEIEANLEKVGWSSERIRYVMRKYAGKRTGMLEIPITKLAEKAGGKPKSPK